MPTARNQLEHHPHLDSTNQLALTRIHSYWQNEKSPHALVITADSQSAGRGQHGRAWISPPGGLYLSAIVERLAAEFRDKLALIAGVATAKALRNTTQQSISLRWPNDLILDGKKIGGILCEAAASGDRWAGVIGIGLNINTHLGEFPEPLQRTATSLLHHLGQPQDAASIQRALLTELLSSLDQVEDEGLAPIIAAARQMDSLRGHALELQDAGRRLIGIAVGISETGQLLLQTDSALEPLTTATLLTIDGIGIR